MVGVVVVDSMALLPNTWPMPVLIEAPPPSRDRARQQRRASLRLSCELCRVQQVTFPLAIPNAPSHSTRCRCLDASTRVLFQDFLFPGAAFLSVLSSDRSCLPDERISPNPIMQPLLSPV